MKHHSCVLRTLITLIITTIPAMALAEGVAIEGIACTNPEYHCPDENCSGELIAQRGNLTDALTGRNYFLDYPCDLQQGEDVLFVLNLHGGGSIGNWQRHYFPILDYKDKYRIIVATPSGVVRAWVPENDDAHLQNIVSYVYQKFSNVNIKAFWLAGHSQGGATSHRIVCNEFFADKVDGLLSLAGGRIGNRAPVQECNYSHIYETGEHDSLGAQGVPTTSPLAEKYNCDARIRHDDIVDTKAGYVYDSRTEGRPTREGWGGKPAPGTAEVYEFPNCDDGRVIADVIRLNKGHTEGLEPLVTERLIQLMLSASASKLGK